MARAFARILIVDDDDLDLMFIRRALENVFDNAVIATKTSGEDALSSVRTARQDTDRPELIMLDLNMPGMPGMEVLDNLKRDRELCHVPVIICSTTTDPTEVRKCYEAGANAFMSKPASVDGYNHMVKCLRDFWFDAAIL